MLTRVQKWGNSLAVRIPKPIAEELGLAAHSEVRLAFRDGSLVVSPISIQKYSLAHLLSRITKKNMHREIVFGAPQGKEIW
jgi:antitoxin MazE